MKLDLERIFKGVVLSLVFLGLSGGAIFAVNQFISSNFLTAGILAVPASLNEEGENLNQQPAEPPAQDFIEPAEPEDNLTIYAKSAVAVETDLAGKDKILFEKNADKKLPIASLTKLMTAVVVVENYDLIQNVIVSEKADSQDAMQPDLKTGDIFSVTELLYFSLIRSSNKAAYALSEQIGQEVFVDLMNKKAAEAGLQNTFFKDPTGLSPENVSTAKDLQKFAEYIIKHYPEVINITRTKKLNLPNLGEIENTNEILGEIPDIMGGKTGFTKEAGGCMLLIRKNLSTGGFFIYVILGSDDRFAEMRKLIMLSNL